MLNNIPSKERIIKEVVKKKAENEMDKAKGTFSNVEADMKSKGTDMGSLVDNLNLDNPDKFNPITQLNKPSNNDLDKPSNNDLNKPSNNTLNKPSNNELDKPSNNGLDKPSNINLQAGLLEEMPEERMTIEDKLKLMDQVERRATPFGFKSSFILDGVEIPIEHIVKYIVDIYDVKNQFMHYIVIDDFNRSIRKIKQYIGSVTYDGKINDAVINLFDHNTSLFMGDLGMVMKLNKELSEFDKQYMQLELESVDKEFREYVERGLKIFIFMLFNYTLGLIAFIMRQNRELDDDQKKRLVEYSMLIMDKINRFVQSQIKILDEKCNILKTMVETSNKIKESSMQKYNSVPLRSIEDQSMNELHKRALMAVVEDIPNTLEEINMKLSDIDFERGFRSSDLDSDKGIEEVKTLKLKDDSNIISGLSNVQATNAFEGVKRRLSDASDKLKNTEFGEKLLDGVRQGTKVISDKIEDLKNVRDENGNPINYCHKACDKVEGIIKSIPSSKDIKNVIGNVSDKVKSIQMSDINSDTGLKGGSYNDITTSRTREYSESIYKNIDSILSSNDSSDMQYY